MPFGKDHVPVKSMTKVRIFLERVSAERKIGDLTGNFCQLVRVAVRPTKCKKDLQKGFYEKNCFASGHRCNF